MAYQQFPSVQDNYRDGTTSRTEHNLCIQLPSSNKLRDSAPYALFYHAMCVSRLYVQSEKRQMNQIKFIGHRDAFSFLPIYCTLVNHGTVLVAFSTRSCTFSIFQLAFLATRWTSLIGGSSSQTWPVTECWNSHWRIFTLWLMLALNPGAFWCQCSSLSVFFWTTPSSGGCGHRLHLQPGFVRELALQVMMPRLLPPPPTCAFLLGPLLDCQCHTSELRHRCQCLSSIGCLLFWLLGFSTWTMSLFFLGGLTAGGGRNKEVAIEWFRFFMFQWLVFNFKWNSNNNS